MSSAGRSAAQPVASLPPGLNAVAGLRGAPPRRKRSITRPRDHVTVWPLFHAIISLSICPNDARPIRPPPPPRNLRSPPCARISVCVASTCTMRPLSSTRAHYTPPLCTWTRAYSLTCVRIHAYTGHTLSHALARSRSPSLNRISCRRMKIIRPFAESLREIAINARDRRINESAESRGG